MFFDPIPKALYIHIPFCKKKCSYCDFFSIPFSSPSLLPVEDSFIDSILKETINQIIYFNKALNINTLKTIYIGGGTPSAIGKEKLGKLIKTVVSMYDDLPEEFTVEVNPETVNRDLLKMLNDLPVSRISLGVQSFNKKMLDTLGRNATVEAVYNALESIKKYSNKKLSIDLISSIPGQSIDEALSDVTTALSFKPGHISLYYLTIEEGTKLYQKYSEKDQDERCWIDACGLLEASGYYHYEVSNFCLPENECLHNANYWKIEPYIGCGLSAVSTYYSKGMFHRISVNDDPDVFLKGEKTLWGMEKEIISNRDFLIDLLMMGLRTKDGVNLKETGDFFNIDLKKSLEPVIVKWDTKGYITLSEHMLALNKNGIYFHTSFMIDIMECIDKIAIK